MQPEKRTTLAAHGRRLGSWVGAIAGFFAVASLLLPIPYGGGLVLVLPLGLLGLVLGGLAGALALGLIGYVAERLMDGE